MMIAVSIAANTVEEMWQRAPETESVADVIEFRLDSLRELTPEEARVIVTERLRHTALPVILTCRPWEVCSELGSWSLENRVRLWRSLFSVNHQNDLYFDLELDLVNWFRARHESIPWKQIIASYHNFIETPATLSELYESLANTRAGILKVAPQAEDISDNLKIFELLRQAQQTNRKFIGIARGAAGLITRILGPLYGSFLTFGALTSEEQTAPGQIVASELRGLYRLHELGPRPKVMGVIGNPISHSLSPLIHGLWPRNSGVKSGRSAILPLSGGMS